VAAITNTFSTATAIGQREDLSDKIFDITPEETVLLSALGRDKSEAIYTEWQQDALPARRTTSYPEGDDVSSFAAITPTVRIGNYQQIARREWLISNSLEEVNKAGRRSEMAYQKTREMVALRLDIENFLTANQGASSASPRYSAGMGAWVKTNVSLGAGGGNPVYTNTPTAARTDGTQRTFSKTQVDAVMQLCWDNGAQPKMVLVGSFNKRQFSTFTGIASQQVQINGPKQTFIVGGASVYVSDFGNLVVVPNRNQRARDAWFVDTNYVKVSFLRNPMYKELATTGDAEKRMIVAEFCLKVLHEKALGLVADLTTS
jgi:hypothetical protein